MNTPTLIHILEIIFEYFRLEHSNIALLNDPNKLATTL